MADRHNHVHLEPLDKRVLGVIRKQKKITLADLVKKTRRKRPDVIHSCVILDRNKLVKIVIDEGARVELV